MPCRDGGPSISDVQEAQNRLNKVTQNLCYLCGEAEHNEIFDKLSENNYSLRRW